MARAEGRTEGWRLMVRLGVTLGVVLVAIAGLILGALLIGRSMFGESGVPAARSVVQELGVERVLLVFAHPDDEILATELIRGALRDGAEVALVTATRGEAGTQVPVIVAQEHLGVVRAGEAYRHGWALGVTDQAVLDLGDGRLADLALEVLTEVVGAHIARVRPDLIVTFHPESGISLHPDHLRIGEATVRAARAAVTEGVLEGVQVAYVLAPRPGLRRFGGEREGEVADRQPEPDFALRADAAPKRRAWRIHASQADYIPASTGLPVWLLYALWSREYYAVETIEPL